MTVGELIRALSYWSPDTKVSLLDGNLLTREFEEEVVYSEDDWAWLEDINDGRGADGNTLFLLTD